MAFTVDKVRTFQSAAQELHELLGDAIDSAVEYLEAMNDKDADDDDRGLAEQSLEEAIDGLNGIMLSLDNLVKELT